MCESRRDGGGSAGRGGRGQCDSRQINGTRCPQPKQVAINPSTRILLKRWVGLDRRDLKPGRLLITRAEGETLSYRQRFSQWCVVGAWAGTHIDGIRIE